MISTISTLRESEKLSDLSKVTQQVAELGLQPKPVQSKNLCTAFCYTNYIYNFPLAPKSVNKLLWEVEDEAKQKLLLVIHAWWSVQNFDA